jgi:hypothetical protein
MLIRAIALSIALLVGVGAIIPLATESASAHKHHKYKHRKYKKYSKAWWRQYHARMHKRQALMARRRALRLKQLRLEKAAQDQKTTATGDKKVMVKTSAPETTALLPSGEEAPRGWKKGSATAGEIQFRVDDSSGAQVGSVSLTVVGPAMGLSGDVGRNKSLAGVPTASLRREVINRMISENGWVVNDYEKDVNGKKVYVVVAQSQAGGHVNSRMFYFTEVDGRIYSLATTANSDSADRISEESEKVINSLQNVKHPAQRAGLKSEE